MSRTVSIKLRKALRMLGEQKQTGPHPYSSGPLKLSIERRGHHRIEHNDRERGRDHRKHGGPADVLGASVHSQAAVTAYHHDDNGIDDGLYYSGVEVLEHQHVERLAQIRISGNAEAQRTEQEPPDQRRKIRQDRERGKGHDEADKPVDDEKPYGVNRHGLKGEDLFRDLHGPDAGRERRADPARDDQGGDKRAHLAEHRHRDKPGYIAERPQFLELKRYQDGKRNAEEDRNRENEQQ